MLMQVLCWLRTEWSKLGMILSLRLSVCREYKISIAMSVNTYATDMQPTRHHRGCLSIILLKLHHALSMLYLLNEKPAILLSKLSFLTKGKCLWKTLAPGHLP